MLINAAQTARPGRGWWRNIIDYYGAADILVAEASLHREYPGGPAVARFIGRHGPDGEILGGFELTAKDSDDIPRMMAEGVARMDELFTLALARAICARDPSLIIAEPPPPVEEEEWCREKATVPARVIQLQILTRDEAGLSASFGAMRGRSPGSKRCRREAPRSAAGRCLLVTYRGEPQGLATAMSARGMVGDRRRRHAAGHSARRAAGAAGRRPPQPGPPAENTQAPAGTQ